MGDIRDDLFSVVHLIVALNCQFQVLPNGKGKNQSISHGWFNEQFSCVCPGYEGDGRICTQADICSSNNGGCYPLASCSSSPGTTSMILKMSMKKWWVCSAQRLWLHWWQKCLVLISVLMFPSVVRSVAKSDILCFNIMKWKSESIALDYFVLHLNHVESFYECKVWLVAVSAKAAWCWYRREHE